MSSHGVSPTIFDCLTNLMKTHITQSAEGNTMSQETLAFSHQVWNSKLWQKDSSSSLSLHKFWSYSSSFFWPSTGARNWLISFSFLSKHPTLFCRFMRSWWVMIFSSLLLFLPLPIFTNSLLGPPDWRLTSPPLAEAPWSTAIVLRVSPQQWTECWLMCCRQYQSGLLSLVAAEGPELDKSPIEAKPNLIFPLFFFLYFNVVNRWLKHGNNKNLLLLIQLQLRLAKTSFLY